MGHGHDHSAGDAAVPRRYRRLLTAVAVAIGVLTVAGVVVLWPSHSVRGNVSKLGLISKVYAATVVKTAHGPCGGVSGGSTKVKCEQVTFKLTQGPDAGRRKVIEFADSPSAPQLSTGDKVVLNHIPNAPTGFEYTYNDRQRRPVLVWLAILFAVAVIALGRLRGLAALVSLGASIVVILQFIVPSMLDGNSPPLVAIVGASAVAYLALYISNGLRPMTTVALLGTLSALALTVGLATLFTHLAHFTGAQNEDALLVTLGTHSVDLKGLVLAGMVLGALGALNDITVTQASSVGELRTSNPTFSQRELYRSGLRIGRDHISSTVNTLALAYAGASLPLLILFSLSAQSLGTVANGEVVAIEIVATLVGSIGLVVAVPISTWFAALVATEHHQHPTPTQLTTSASGETHEHAAPHGPEPEPEPDPLIVGVRSQHILETATPTRRERRTRRRSRTRTAPPPITEDLLAPRDQDEFWE